MIDKEYFKGQSQVRRTKTGANYNPFIVDCELV